MKSLLNETKLPFLALAKARERMDDSDDGMGGRCGNWELGLGGYDHGYEIYYKGAPIGRVNYELREYELYHDDFIPKELIPEFLAALDARKFKDVGYHEGDDEDFEEDDGPRYVQESIGNLESFLAEKEKEFKPSRVNPSWDESENKIWAVEDYLSMMGEFTDEDREYLRETDPELLSLEENEDDGQDMFNEDGVKKRKLTGARSHITKDGMRGWSWDPKRDGYYIAKNDFPEKFMDKFVPFLKGLRNEHCELDMWANSKNRLFIRWVGEKTKDKHWWHKLNITGSPAEHEMASFAQESLKEFVEEIEQFIGKSDLSDVIQVNPNWRFWEGDCKDKSCNIGGKVGSINFLSELEPEQVKNFYDNMDTYAMLESRKVNESTEKRTMKKIVKEADGMGMSYDELMAEFLEIQKKLGKKSKNTLVYWTYEPMDEGVQEYLDRKGYEPMGTWYSVQYSSELCWPTGAWLGSKHEKTRQATSVQELCDWFEKNQEKLGGCKFIGALSGYENVNDIKIENGRVVVVFGKTEEVITEGDEGYDSDTPKIYVGTYSKYNNGSIDGKWITISDYNTYEEFVDACRELHSDESDPEFMVQDYENFPRRWYHEGGLPSEEEFDKINEFYMMDDGDKEAYEAFLDLNLWDDDSIETFLEKYEGHFNTPEDFGVHAVDTFGMPENAEYYIDYEAFGRDITMDWHRGDEDEKDAEGEPEDPDYYYDSEGYQQMAYGSDAEVGEQYIDDVGMDGLGKDSLDYYFDYDQFGRELLMTDFVEQDGFIFSNY